MKIKKYFGITAVAALALAACQPKQEAKPDFLTEEINNIVAQHTLQTDIIEKSGTWYSYKGERLGQGKENVKVFLKEHGDIADEIEQIIRDTLAAEPEKFEDVMEEPMQADDLPDTLAETDGE